MAYTSMQDSITVALHNAKIKLAQCVNTILSQPELNFYLIAPIFADLNAQIQNAAQNDLAQAQAQMKAQLQQDQIHNEAEIETEQEPSTTDGAE